MQVNPQRHPSPTVITDAGGFLTADVLHLTARDAITVAVVDGNGNQVTSFGGGTGGGGTQFADNAASGLAPIGMLGMGWDSANAVIRALKVDASQNLEAIINNFPSVYDISDRSARLLGHVTVDNASFAVTNAGLSNIDVLLSTRTKPSDQQHTLIDNASVAVTGTFWQVTQPVSLAAAVDVSDRAARLVGHVTVDSAPTTAVTIASLPNEPNLDVALSTRLKPADTLAGVTTVGSITNPVAVTGTFWQATQPISGTVTTSPPANASTNIAQVNGSTVVTAATGVQKIGIVGSSNAALDSTIGAATAPTNALAVASVYQSTVPALTAGQAVAQQCDTTGSVYANSEGRRQTYRMAVRGFTPVASASAPCFSIQGSATKTIRIQHIRVTYSCTTGAALPNDISLQKFSVLTGGTTANTPTGAKNDSNNAAQTAICLQYSAVPTTATVIGGISAVERMYWITSGATTQAVPPAIDWTFGNLNQQGLTLRGTAEYFGIVVAAVGTTPVMSVLIEYTEE